jgi:hypothetical protein
VGEREVQRSSSLEVQRVALAGSDIAEKRVISASPTLARALQ